MKKPLYYVILLYNACSAFESWVCLSFYTISRYHSLYAKRFKHNISTFLLLLLFLNQHHNNIIVITGESHMIILLLSESAF